MTGHVVVAGASGFLGSHLVDDLRADGVRVTTLVRRPATGPDESTWDPPAGRVDHALLGTADVVVTLAGSPTLGNPHSRAWARELMTSRVTTTSLLAEAIAGISAPPAYVVGNATGWYGDHGAEPCPESADSRGDALLTRVCRAWQEAADPAVGSGARVVFVRTAPVLDARNAPLRQMLLPFRLGLGARLGDGTQHFACVSLRDWVSAVRHLLDSDLAGPVNVTCPVTPTNAEFTDALASAVGRTARLHAPAAILEKAAGEMAPDLLGSCRAVPEALQESGFVFADQDVTQVVAAGLA